MGCDAKAEICYGIPFEDNHEFPWDNEDIDQDINDWWRIQQGWNDSISPYDQQGEYKPGFNQNSPEIKQYFEKRRLFDQTHPLPIELVMSGSYETCSYILAVKNTNIRTSWDEPKPFIPDLLQLNPKDFADFQTFIEKYQLSREKPQWLLAAFYG